MKYLINYNYFTESLNSEKIEWVKDALIELEDDGYNVSVKTHAVYGVSEPGITITIDGKLLPIDIGDYLLTIHSYLSEKGYCGFNAYDYDNESQSRHVVRVRASLKGIDNNFERDLPNFLDMLTRFTVGKAPFDSVSVSYYKPNKKVNESSELSKSNYTLDGWPEGEYSGTISGYSVYSDEIDSGFKTTTGLRNVFPIPCKIYIENGGAIVFYKGGVLFSDEVVRDKWKAEFGSLENDSRFENNI
jgi:hypothetical protein